MVALARLPVSVLLVLVDFLYPAIVDPQLPEPRGRLLLFLPSVWAQYRVCPGGLVVCLVVSLSLGGQVRVWNTCNFFCVVASARRHSSRGGADGRDCRDQDWRA